MNHREAEDPAGARGGQDPNRAEARHERLSTLFLRMRAEGEPEKRRLMAQVKADDPALAQELCGMLAHSPPASRDGGAPIELVPMFGEGFQVAPLVDDLLAAPAEDRVPEQLGPFRIVRQVGQGSFARVFLAEQSVPVRRRVALKVLRPGVGGREILARFERERQALARLESSNIARLFQAGRDDDRLWMAMEFVDGMPITTFADARGLGLEERLGLLCAVCGAVQHAHRRGVLHRDLKPSNVLVAETELGPLIKVIDFGVAKAIAGYTGGGLADRSYETMDGRIVGTPSYMSPEQLDGRIHAIDTRSDVYALGVLAHELVCGRRPVDLEGVSAPRARALVAERSPVRLSSIPRRQRQDLETVLEWALAHDPDRRCGSPCELAVELEHVREGSAVGIRRASIAERVARWSGRHRTWSAGIVVGSLGLTAVLALLFALVNETRRRNIELRASVRTELAAILSLRDLHGAGPAMDLLLPNALAQSAVLLRTDPDDPDLLRTRSDLLDIASLKPMAEDRLDEAASLRAEALTLRKRLLASPGPTAMDDRLALSLASVRLGDVDQARGDFDAATRRYRDALRIQLEEIRTNPNEPQPRLLAIEGWWRLAVTADLAGQSVDRHADEARTAERGGAAGASRARTPPGGRALGGVHGALRIARSHHRDGGAPALASPPGPGADGVRPISPWP